MKPTLTDMASASGMASTWLPALELGEGGVAFGPPERRELAQVEHQQLDVEVGEHGDPRHGAQHHRLLQKRSAGQDGPVVFEDRHRLIGVRHPEHQPHEEGDGETARPQRGKEVER
jgi:hypothetical protein